MSEEQQTLPSVSIHMSKTGRVQITFAGAVAGMDEATGEAVLTIHAMQLEELRDAIKQFLPS